MKVKTEQQKAKNPKKNKLKPQTTKMEIQKAKKKTQKSPLKSTNKQSPAKKTKKKNPLSRRPTKELLRMFKADKVMNANAIVEIVNRLEHTDASEVVEAVSGVYTVFTRLLREGDIKPVSKKPDDLLTAGEKFSKWLLVLYNKAFKTLLALLKHQELTVAELSLCSVVKLVQAEGIHPVQPFAVDQYTFPKQRLAMVMSELVCPDTDMRHLVTLLVEYLEFDDFMYYTLIVLGDRVNKQKQKGLTEVFINNIFPLLERIDPQGQRGIQGPKLLLLPEGEKTEQPMQEEEEQQEESQEEEEEDDSLFCIDYDRVRKAINTIWPEVLKGPLSHDLYRRSLIHIPDKVMPFLHEPILLTDFFMESYNIGGAISLLALQGVFVLIHKYNLEYPDFYGKVYALLQPQVLQAKYKPRFFMLLDKFLSSTHLPEYLVAAFVKRLSRLALSAPAPCQLLLLKFIVNLIKRFPGLKRLIHNPVGEAPVEDPYNPQEANLSQCLAGDSSLWEVATLAHHALPQVSRGAGFLQKNLPDVEFDVGEFVEMTYDEMFEYACKLQVKDGVSKTFHQPKGVFHHPDDAMSQAWTLV